MLNIYMVCKIILWNSWEDPPLYICIHSLYQRNPNDNVHGDTISLMLGERDHMYQPYQMSMFIFFILENVPFLPKPQHIHLKALPSEPLPNFLVGFEVPWMSYERWAMIFPHNFIDQLWFWNNTDLVLIVDDVIHDSVSFILYPPLHNITCKIIFVIFYK